MCGWPGVVGSRAGSRTSGGGGMIMARKRRGRGEGSVFQRADGRWVGSVGLGYGGDGKRKRRTVYGATKQEVVEKLDQLRGDARAGTLPDAGGLTVGQLLDRWLQV